MDKGTVCAGQSFLDKMVEMTGSAESTLSMAVLNGVSITAALEVGQQIKSTGFTNRRIADLFGLKNRPATDFTDEVTEVELFELPGELPMSL